MRNRFQKPSASPLNAKETAKNQEGLLYSGTLEGQQVAFIPPDVRPLLLKLLKNVNPG